MCIQQRWTLVVMIIGALGVVGCGDVKSQGAADASGMDAARADGGADVPDATVPTCTDGVQNGDEEAIDCGGSCDACIECTVPSECDSGECRDGTCAVTRTEACTDAAPANGTSTVADVMTTYTPGSGWSTPADCAWTCDTDYAESAATCINQKTVSCTDAAPTNGTSTVANVAVTYTTAGGWTTAAPCAWSCNADYEESAGTCINQKTVACTDAAPANASSTAGDVTVTYTNAGGWTTPANCAWTCNANYDQSGSACINQAVVSCTDAAPANATSSPGSVTITYTDAGGWTTPATCAWTCDANYDQSGSACINQTTALCVDAAPANATSSIVSVTITYTDAGGWTTPANCSWTCNANYDLQGGACINQQRVTCTDAAPANATSTLADVTITYTDAGGWTTPADCTWTCNGNFCRNGNVCDPPSYLEQKFDLVGSGSSWFGGEDRVGIPSRNVGSGQRLTASADLAMTQFAFYYTSAFNSPANGGPGVAVTLQLDVYDVNGKALTTTQVNVPASFTGGWVWFDVVGNLKKGTVYYFNSFLVNGYTLGVSSGIRADTGDDYPGGYRTGATDSDGATDLGTFPPWGTTQNTWDYWFWARSAPFCPAN